MTNKATLAFIAAPMSQPVNHPLRNAGLATPVTQLEVSLERLQEKTPFRWELHVTGHVVVLVIFVFHRHFHLFTRGITRSFCSHCMCHRFTHVRE